MFSSRVPRDRTPNQFSVALARARARGGLLDLTSSNPTHVGFEYPPDLLAALGHPSGLGYSPSAFGLADARAAVAEGYARRGLDVHMDRIVLTASTSEAYSILFKLLCEPRQSAVLTPVPSYPLFEHLTALDGVVQERYPLDFHGTWMIDFDSVDSTWSDSTAAVLAVSPNNPTGSVLRGPDADELDRRCASREAAIILDEVFCDYPLMADLAELTPLPDPQALTFRLGGFSKTIGLPQLKLAWIGVQGPASLVTEALDRLELIADTYLSVSTPVQLAARQLLDRGAAVRTQILERVRRNFAALQRILSDSGATVLPADGGWSAVIRVPATRTEDELVLDLLEHDGVAVHPGYFFDFPHEAFLVVSLLPDAADFARGIQLVQDRINGA